MRDVVRLFWGICLLRQSPAYVPTAPWFVATVTALNIGVGLALAVTLADKSPTLRTAATVVVGQATLAVLVWTAFSLRELTPRFPAVITAMFGCDALLSVLLAAVRPLTSLMTPTATQGVYVVFVFWSVAVAGYILHRGLNIHLTLGVALAFGMTIFTVLFAEVVTAQPGLF